MSLLFPRQERRAIDPSSLFAPDWGGGVTALAGEPVTFSTAMGLDAVAACVGLFSDVLGMLPLHAYRDEDGTPVRLANPPQLVADPSLTVDPDVWRVQFIVSQLLWGNAYGLVMTRDGYGYPTTVEWLDPQRMQVEEESSIQREPVYRMDGQPIPADRLIHVPGRFVRPGSRVGLAPLSLFRETFGLGLAARNYGAKWFGDGAHPSSVLTTDQVLPDADTAKTIKERFMAAMRNRREPAVLGAGIKYEQVQVAPNESQFIETKQEAAVAVARAFGVQPEMIFAAMGGGGSVTYANREQRAIDFLTFSADPHLVRFERMVTRNLPNRQYAQLERGALLRTDIETRYKAHDLAIRAGWRTPNEARQIEDEKPLEGQGDEALWPPYSASPAPQGATP